MKSLSLILLLLCGMLPALGYCQGLIAKEPFPGCNAIIIKTKYNATQVVGSVAKSLLQGGFESETYEPSRPLFRTKAAFATKGKHLGITEQYAFSGISGDTSAVAIYGWHGYHSGYTTTPFAAEKIVYRPEKQLEKAYWDMLMRWVTVLAPYTVEVYYTVY